jgi:4-amino-4-deoxy-L-arabinose transferase-like glycosyltransferase
MNKLKKSYLLFIPIGLLVLFLLGRLQIGFERFFDPDEMANANWAYLIFRGAIPYRDFFYFYTPVFHWLFSIVFILPEGPYLILVMRLLIWCMYVTLTYVLYKIVYKISQKRILALCSCLIFVIFPMTFDKTIDIRPDTLMTLLFFTGVYLLFIADRQDHKKFFIAGLLISASCLVLMKMIYAFPALIYLIFSTYRRKHMPEFIHRQLMPFIIGFIIPFILFIFYLFMNHAMLIAWDDIIRVLLMYNFYLGQSFTLLDVLGPWPLIYLQNGGVSLPWVIQISIWTLGIFGIPIVIVQNRRFGIFITVFIVFTLAFLFLFERPFVQYFIPLSVIFSITSIYSLESIFNLIKSLQGTILFRTTLLAIILIIFLGLLSKSFLLQYYERIVPTNTEQLEVLKQVHEHIPKNEPAVDLVGSYVYRFNGFFYNFPLYASVIDKINPKAESLTESLIRTQTKYLVLDQKGYIFWTAKAGDIQFMLTHYLLSPWFKIYTPGVTFVCKQAGCTQYTPHGSPAFTTASDTFSFHIKGFYTLMTEPKGFTILLNGLQVNDGEDKLYLPSIYKFSVPIGLQSFVLQYSVNQ